MLTRLAATCARHPKLVLFAALLALVVLGVLGASAPGHLRGGGFADPAAPSSRANALLESKFQAGDQNLVFLVTAAEGVDSRQARSVADDTVAALGREADVSQVVSYWSMPAPFSAQLRSTDGRIGVIAAHVAGDDAQAPERAAAIAAPLTGRTGSVDVQAGGLALGTHEVDERISHDLLIAEAVAIPITAVALTWVFGSVVAAALPVLLGLASIVSTLGVLRLIADVTPVSVYALNMTTALGLALAIDYSLFIVSRYREELAAGVDTTEAIVRAMGTAGRTAVVSAAAVTLSLAVLAIFPLYFLRSFAYAGVAVVVVSAAAAILVMPAALALLGNRVGAWDLRVTVRRALRRPPPRPFESESPFWGRVAERVMRRPVLFGAAALLVLLTLGAPVLSMRVGLPDERTLPATASTRMVGDTVRAEFTGSPQTQLTVVAPDTTGSPDALGSYAAALSKVPGVTAVISSAGITLSGQSVSPGPAAKTTPMTRGDSSYLYVENAVEPYSSQGQQLVRAVRAVPAPWPVQVTGLAAENVDTTASLVSRLPLAAVLIGVPMLVVLYFFTRSLVLPVKALVLTLLSLTATFGAMVWIFQDGHLAGLFGVTPTGYLSAAIPILMFCLAFGASMDYEVFLLSRIREEWLVSGDNTRAVARGLARTGRIITAAAVIMAIVFIAAATSSISFIDLFGAGMALAVLMDATVVRGVLVPAFMRLFGAANWWPSRATVASAPAREHVPGEHTPAVAISPALHAE
ncbi:MMPL family transporter [Rhodococcus spelaei]|uniref:MMPL family transporter n=1 Tax=Rhodococcus spelaei TaxID=2546320 RepID=A0A541B9T6_9NOCA|nr:MMPL family transporter [Rhodococcus spelaei]TQF69092.1 MMPL family transporter [Rhodococcus spelaei]